MPTEVMDEEEKVAHFMSVTGVSEEIARRYLDICAGDLNMAISMQLESNEGLNNPSTSDNSGSAASVPQSSNMLSPSSYEKIFGVRAPIPQTSGVLIDGETPPRKVLRSRRLPQTVFDPFQDYSTVASRNVRKHENDAARRNLAELFRPPFDLLFNGTFHEARLAGQQKKRWLLVNLQDSKEFSSQILNRDVWSNHNVKELIKLNFIFLQIHRINDDGVRFKQLYHVNSYPCIAIIDPRTGEKMMSWGAMTADDFIREISEFIINNPYEDGRVNEELQHQETIINQSEESQLEAAIKASLDDICAQKSDTNTIPFSDDDSDIEYISFSPPEESTSIETYSSASDIRSIGPSSSFDRKVDRERSGWDSVNKYDSTYTDGVKDVKSRKRFSSHHYKKDSKKLRTDIEPMCTAIDNIELAQTKIDNCTEKEPYDCITINGNTKKGEKRKGKGKGRNDTPRKMLATSHQLSGHDEDDCTAIEDHTVDQSHILFRLPDGTRLQKSFPSSQPIKVLFRFLEDHGLKMSEHEVITHFPKRSVLDMDHSTSLKHNGLYPRETIFVHTV